MVNVSVIVPVYNAQEYIEQCLTSLLSQSLSNIEILVIDDGSTDESVKKVRQLQKRDCRIHLLQQEKQQGPGSARNKGMQEAQGEYIGFVDSDDYCNKAMFHALYGLAKKTDVDVAMCNVAVGSFSHSEILLPKDAIWHPDIYREKKEDVLDLSDKSRLNYIATAAWNKIYRRSFLLDNALFFPESQAEDMLFFVRMGLLLDRIAHCDDSLYVYRQGRMDQLSYAACKCLSEVFELYVQVEECVKHALPLPLAQKMWLLFFLRHLFSLYNSTKRRYQFHDARLSQNEFMEKSARFLVERGYSSSALLEMKEVISPQFLRDLLLAQQILEGSQNLF